MFLVIEIAAITILAGCIDSYWALNFPIMLAILDCGRIGSRVERAFRPNRQIYMRNGGYDMILCKNRPKTRFVLILAALLWMSFAPLARTADEGASEVAHRHAQPAASQVEILLERMSLEQKIGQMIMTSIVGTRMNPQLAGFLAEFRPGGITIFSYNIKSAEQLRRLMRKIYAVTGPVTPFLSIDQEGGLVSRIPWDIVELPGNMALGAAHSPALAEEAGRLLGEGLRAYGFNMNLAPVLDVNSNPANSVIGLRSYSSDPDLAGRLGAAFIKGLHARGIIAVGKHFPGHGDTAADSHASLPVLRINDETLMARELVPFTMAQSAGLDALMTAHIAVPHLQQGRMLPATVSKAVLSGLLRKRLNFDGLIITDGLEMGAIIKATGGLKQASVAAVLAGADMLTINADPAAARMIAQALLVAVRDGVIGEARINESVRRILAVKSRHGLLGKPPAIAAPSDTARMNYQHLTTRIASRAITIARNEGGLLPLDSKTTQRILVVGSDSLAEAIRHAMPRTRVQRIAVSKAAGAISIGGRHPDAVIIEIHDHKRLVEIGRIQKAGIPVIAVNTGLPYLIAQAQPAAWVLTYSKRPAALRAAAEVLAGRFMAHGQLPVAVSRRYPLGHAVMLQTPVRMLKTAAQ